MRRKGLLVREVGGEVLVLDTVADRIHQLNISASIIWRMHDQGTTVEQIARSLASQFDVDETMVQSDVQETLTQFRDLDLIASAEHQGESVLA